MKPDGRILAISLAAPLLLAAAPPQYFPNDWRNCQDAQASAPSARRFSACVAASGPRATEELHVRLGDLMAAAIGGRPVSRNPGAGGFTIDIQGSLVTDMPVNVEWETLGKTFTFNDVGGTGITVLALSSGVDKTQRSLWFSWQNRPLALREALDRGQRLQAWLSGAGYRLDHRKDHPWDRPFGILDNYVDKEPQAWANNWRSAKAVLAAESQNAEGMRLYTMMSPEAEVRVSVENMRRSAVNYGDRSGKSRTGSVFDGDGGYEWKLQISIDPPGKGDHAPSHNRTD